MKILLSVVADISPCLPPSAKGVTLTTWWTREIEVINSDNLEDVITRKVHELVSNYPSQKVENRPNVLSISHSILS